MKSAVVGTVLSKISLAEWRAWNSRIRSKIHTLNRANQGEEFDLEDKEIERWNQLMVNRSCVVIVPSNYDQDEQ